METSRLLMDGRTFVITLVALSLLSMTLAPWTDPSTVMADETDCPPPDFSKGTSVFHQIIMLQGNDPDTEAQEAKGNVQMIQRTYWRIPWDSDEVYMSVPIDAADLSLDHVDSVPHQGSSVFVPGRYSLSQNPDDPPETGRVSGGDFDGFYYWRFPSMADRDTDATLTFNTTEDFEDYDDNFTDPEEWEISNGTLTLAGNVSSATYTSKMYLGGEDIKSVNLTYDGLVMDNMSFEITIDNGTTWMPVENGKVMATEEEGSEFRWRVTMTQNVSDPLPPVLDLVAAMVVFTPPWTEIWLEASYSMWIPKEGLEFDLQFPFDPETPGLIFVSYVDLDVELTVTGMEVNRTTGGKYPDKATYTHMMSDYTCTITFEFTYHVEPGTDPDFPWLLYVLPLVLVVLIGLLYYFSAGSRKEPSDDEPDGEDEDEPEDEDEDEPDLDDMDEAELEDRKAMLLGSIKRLEQEHAEGTVGDEELEIRRDMYKQEAIEVMRRLHEMTSEDD